MSLFLLYVSLSLKHMSPTPRPSGAPTTPTLGSNKRPQPPVVGSNKRTPNRELMWWTQCQKSDFSPQSSRNDSTEIQHSSSTRTRG